MEIVIDLDKIRKIVKEEVKKHSDWHKYPKEKPNKSGNYVICCENPMMKREYMVGVWMFIDEKLNHVVNECNSETVINLEEDGFCVLDWGDTGDWYDISSHVVAWTEFPVYDGE